MNISTFLFALLATSLPTQGHLGTRGAAAPVAENRASPGPNDVVKRILEQILDEMKQRWLVVVVLDADLGGGNALGLTVNEDSGANVTATGHAGSSKVDTVALADWLVYSIKRDMRNRQSDNYGSRPVYMKRWKAVPFALKGDVATTLGGFIGVSILQILADNIVGYAREIRNSGISLPKRSAIVLVVPVRLPGAPIVWEIVGLGVDPQGQLYKISREVEGSHSTASAAIVSTLFRAEFGSPPP